MPGPNSPNHEALLAPPEGIYSSFEDLLMSVQRVAKDQGYGVVKLRASNYREGKPTRYDLVCDRGGAKYQSTAKKRTPSTRKIDCPWRAKAVCEVQLGYQWRFAVQDARHNHDARVSSAASNPDSGLGMGIGIVAGMGGVMGVGGIGVGGGAPVPQSIRTMCNKVDRLSHDFGSGLMRMSHIVDNDMGAVVMRMEHLVDSVAKGLENIDARLANQEQRIQHLDSRLQSIEARVNMGIPLDDVDASRLLGDGVM